MKTALIKTSFWKDDAVFELTPDVRFFYLCLLTNPERNTTRVFKCSDRLLVAYTGYNTDTIKLCRNKLSESGLIQYEDGYYILSEQENVEAKKGKLTGKLQDEFISDLPENIKLLLVNSSSVALEEALEYGNVDVNGNVNVNNNGNVNKTKSIEINKNVAEVIKNFEDINPSYSKWYGHDSHNGYKDDIKILLKTKSLEKILEMLESVKVYNTLPFVASYDRIYDPSALLRNWQKVADKKSSIENELKLLNAKSNIIKNTKRSEFAN